MKTEDGADHVDKQNVRNREMLIALPRGLPPLAANESTRTTPMQSFACVHMML
jgi:hypothetical protein